VHIGVTPLALLYGALKRGSDLLPGACGGLDAEVGSVLAAIKIGRIGPYPLQRADACQMGGHEQLESGIKQLRNRGSAVRPPQITEPPTHTVQASRSAIPARISGRIHGSRITCLAGAQVSGTSTTSSCTVSALVCHGSRGLS